MPKKIVIQKEKQEKVLLRLPESLLEALDKLSEASGISRLEAIRYILNKYINDKEKGDET